MKAQAMNGLGVGPGPYGTKEREIYAECYMTVVYKVVKAKIGLISLLSFVANVPSQTHLILLSRASNLELLIKSNDDS